MESPKWTVNDLLKNIPEEWRDAEVAVSDLLERSWAVRRVALHKNRKGRKVVVIHYTEMNDEIPKDAE